MVLIQPSTVLKPFKSLYFSLSYTHPLSFPNSQSLSFSPSLFLNYFSPVDFLCVPAYFLFLSFNLLLSLYLSHSFALFLPLTFIICVLKTFCCIIITINHVAIQTWYKNNSITFSNINKQSQVCGYKQSYLYDRYSYLVKIESYMHHMDRQKK